MSLTVSLNIPNDAIPGAYNINLTLGDESGQPSHSLQLPVTVAEDFSVSSATASQTVTAGQTMGAYQLTIAPNPPGSSFSGSVQLACTGLPKGAQCLFSPSTPQIPRDSAVDVMMTISTAAASANSGSSPAKPPFLYAIWLLLPGLVVAGGLGAPKSRRMKRLVLAMAASSFLIFLIACAGVSAGGGGDGGTQNPVSYKITVTGTSSGTAPDPGQSTVVTLVVD
jgi:hypothetical protein